MDDAKLAGVRATLGRRLQREKAMAGTLSEEIKRRAEEYEWDMRVDADEDEEKDDLFDEEEEEADGDVAMKEEEKAAQAPNPRPGWKVTDYLRFLDMGRVPPSQPAAPAPAA
jgi:hypothetical protein